MRNKEKYYLYLYSYCNVWSLISRAIKFAQIWEGPYYSDFTHSEINFGAVKPWVKANYKIYKLLDKIKNYNLDSFLRYWICYSSSIQDWSKTRFKHITNSNGNFHLNKIEVTRLEYINALQYAIINTDKPYWYLWIFLYQILKIERKITYWVFCSETVANVFKYIWILDFKTKSHLINPAKLKQYFDKRE